MRIAGTEMLFGVAAGLVVAVGVFVVGQTIVPPSPPSGPSSWPSDLSGDTPETCLDAPVTAPPTSDVIGQARLCRAGRSVRMVLRASGLDPGVAYTAWLGYHDSSSTCFAGAGGDEGWSSATSGGRMRQIAGVATTPYRELDVDVSLHDLEPASGTRVSLVLLRPGGRAGPHAQVAFTIP